MVIILTQSEKKTFNSFLGLYLGSSLLLLVIIASLFYSSHVSQHYELMKSQMQISANNITHNIVKAHMLNVKLEKENLEVKKGFQYGLYTFKKKPIHTQIDDKIDFTKQYYNNGKNTFYIDKNSAGHLGIFYVVIKESNLSNLISTSLITIVITTIILYILISLIGFYLAKLFIFPIQNQRKKLNNFIKDTTHELNTPLSALLLCVDSDNYYTEQNRNHIRMSSKKISNLYNDLTYLFLKDRSKNKNTNRQISDILNSELEYHVQLSSKKNIIITSNIEETFFHIDKEDFIRIISNLISNAIKYTKRNGKIDITLKDKILTIKDNGIGIEKEKIEKIFNRYYRATDIVGGFGIGLNIVYSICNSYNIKIDIQSEIKKGTSFILTFK